MKLVKTSTIIFTGNIGIAFMALLFGICTARFLTLDERGLLYLVMQVIATGSLIFAAGLGPAYQYSLASRDFGLSEILSHMVVQIFLIAIFLIVIVVSWGVFFSPIGIVTLSQSLLYVSAFGILLNVIIIFANSVLMTKENRIAILSFLNVGSSFLNVIIFIGWTWLFSADIQVALSAYFLSTLAQIIPKIYLAKSGIALSSSLKWTRMTKKLIKFGAPSFLFNLAVALVFRVDTFIVNGLLGLEELGKYAVAVTLAELVLMLPSSIGASLFIHLPGLDPVAQMALLKKTSRIVVALTIGISVTLEVISPLLVTTLMGDKYVDSIAPLRILLPGLVAMAVNYVFANYFAANGRPGIGALAFSMGLFFNIMANFILVPLLGIQGAALASSMAYFFIATIFFFIINKKSGIPMTDFFVPNISDLKEVSTWIMHSIGRVKSFIFHKGSEGL